MLASYLQPLLCLQSASFGTSTSSSFINNNQFLTASSDPNLALAFKLPSLTLNVLNSNPSFNSNDTALKNLININSNKPNDNLIRNSQSINFCTISNKMNNVGFQLDSIKNNQLNDHSTRSYLDKNRSLNETYGNTNEKSEVLKKLSNFSSFINTNTAINLNTNKMSQQPSETSSLESPISLSMKNINENKTNSNLVDNNNSDLLSNFASSNYQSFIQQHIKQQQLQIQQKLRQQQTLQRSVDTPLQQRNSQIFSPQQQISTQKQPSGLEDDLSFMDTSDIAQKVRDILSINNIGALPS